MAISCIIWLPIVPEQVNIFPVLNLLYTNDAVTVWAVQAVSLIMAYIPCFGGAAEVLATSFLQFCNSATTNNKAAISKFFKFCFSIFITLFIFCLPIRDF